MWDRIPRKTLESLKAQGEEIKGEIFGAVRQMMIIEVIQAGVTFLLSMTNPASGIVKAIKATYKAFCDPAYSSARSVVLQQHLPHHRDGPEDLRQRRQQRPREAYQSSFYGEAANAIERVMGLTIPVIIDLFLSKRRRRIGSLHGLGGLPKKVGGKLNKIIDKLLAKVAGVIKKIFGGKKGGGKGKGKKDGLTSKVHLQHKKYVNEIEEKLSSALKKETAEFESFYESKKNLAKKLESTYNGKLTKKVRGKKLKTTINVEAKNSASKDDEIDFSIKIAPNDAVEKSKSKFKVKKPKVSLGDPVKTKHKGSKTFIGGFAVTSMDDSKKSAMIRGALKGKETNLKRAYSTYGKDKIWVKYNPNPYKTGDAWIKIMNRDSWASYEDARQTLNYRYHNKFNNPTAKQWHHIREQSMGGTHNFRNLAIIATKSHEKITSTYTKTDDQYGREFKNLRQFLASKSPAYQWTKGKEVIQDLGYTITTQDKGRGKYQEIN